MIRTIDKTDYTRLKAGNMPRAVYFTNTETGWTFKVHRHPDFPGTWFVSFGPYAYGEMEDLGTDSFRQAVCRAIPVVARREEMKRGHSAREIDELKTFNIDTDPIMEKFRQEKEAV